jgi:hypothetical protein
MAWEATATSISIPSDGGARYVDGQAGEPRALPGTIGVHSRLPSELHRATAFRYRALWRQLRSGSCTALRPFLSGFRAERGGRRRSWLCFYAPGARALRAVVEASARPRRQGATGAPGRSGTGPAGLARSAEAVRARRDGGARGPHQETHGPVRRSLGMAGRRGAAVAVAAAIRVVPSCVVVGNSGVLLAREHGARSSTATTW